MQRGLALRGACLGLLGALLVALVGVSANAAVAAAVDAAVTSSGVLVPVAGAPLGGLVITASNVAFSSNPSHNEVEVLDVATSTLESPISLGTSPRGLDLSPDGSTLYVTEPAASQIAVIDVASRSQVGTITIPAAEGVLSSEPVSVAVADTGNLLVSTDGNGGGALLEVDPVSGATKVLDVPLLGLGLLRRGIEATSGFCKATCRPTRFGYIPPPPTPCRRAPISVPGSAI
jgi:DNA-binding beta-propeller fold protein YncE